MQIQCEVAQQGSLQELRLCHQRCLLGIEHSLNIFSNLYKGRLERPTRSRHMEGEG